MATESAAAAVQRAASLSAAGANENAIPPAVHKQLMQSIENDPRAARLGGRSRADTMEKKSRPPNIGDERTRQPSKFFNLDGGARVQRRNSREDLRGKQRPSLAGGLRKSSVAGDLKGPSRPMMPPPAAKKRRAREAVGIYLLGDSLGSGQFGRVFRGVNSENGEFVAIKQMKASVMDESAVVAFESEIALLEKLNHENIVKYFSVIRTTDHLNLVIEYCDGGALTDIVKKFGNFPEQLCAVYIKQVLRGLDYLHSQGVVHRDIKGANILLTKTGAVKLADFGISTTVGGGGGDMGMDNGAGMGSPYWMSPEVIQMEVQPTAKSDIWSLGATVIELVTGHPPYHQFNPMGAIVRIVQEERPPLPSTVTANLEDLLLKCFQKDINARPSAAELLDHPWLHSARDASNITSASQLKATIKTLNEGFSSNSKITASHETLLGEEKSSSAGSTSVRIYGESIRSDSPFKTAFLTETTTVEEVIQIVLRKYGFKGAEVSEFALWEDKDNGESRQLNDSEALIPIINSWGAGENRYHYRLSLRRKPEALRFKDGYLQLLMTRHVFGFAMQSWQPRYIQFDAENRFLAVFRNDNANGKPLMVVYNLGMIDAVQEETNDPATNTFEISVKIRGRPWRFRAADNGDMTSWIAIIRGACNLSPMKI